MPFIAFYITGLIFEMDALYLIKFFLISCFYALLHFVGQALFDEELKNLLPLSVYLATKVIKLLINKQYIQGGRDN